MEILREKRYLGILGNALILIGLFLPIISMPESVAKYAAAVTSNTLISSGTGIVIAILTVISLVIIFADKISALSKFDNQKLTLVPTIISAIIIIMNIVNASSIMAIGAALGISYGIGVWVIAIGLVLAVVYPFLYKGNSTQA